MRLPEASLLLDMIELTCDVAVSRGEGQGPVNHIQASQYTTRISRCWEHVETTRRRGRADRKKRVDSRKLREGDVGAGMRLGLLILSV